MCFRNVWYSCFAAVCCWLTLASPGWGAEPTKIDGMLARAELLVRMGVANNGASRDFEEARSC